jgi:Protein of unknown function (DUF2397)
MCGAVYRSILDVFATAKWRYRLQLRPDEVLAEAKWPNAPQRIEEVNVLLTQSAAWGNLESQPDTARVSSLSDFYRACFLYRLSRGGEAVEAALTAFLQTLQRRAELQSVALEDIAGQLQSLRALAEAAETDVAKVHETLRHLVRVFESLAENAQAFMAGVARSIELRQAEPQVDAINKELHKRPASTDVCYRLQWLPLTEGSEGAPVGLDAARKRLLNTSAESVVGRGPQRGRRDAAAAHCRRARTRGRHRRRQLA